MIDVNLLGVCCIWKRLLIFEYLYILSEIEIFMESCLVVFQAKQ